LFDLCEEDVVGVDAVHEGAEELVLPGEEDGRLGEEEFIQKGLLVLGGDRVLLKRTIIRGGVFIKLNLVERLEGFEEAHSKCEAIK
jgi:hypothetical protein